MPFGKRCEFQTFDACVRFMRRQGHGPESAKRICGKLQAQTERRCMKKSFCFSEVVGTEVGDEDHDLRFKARIGVS